MKLECEEVNVSTSFHNESQAGIKLTGKAFEILSGSLYQFKVAAIVRELSCNAYDAHVDAGKQDVPFRVTLPSSVHQYFEIEDFGIGLDDFGVRQVYLTLFESTKSGSNDKIGAFGLGAKTPISYAGTFNIRARKDGVERFYTCYKGKDGIPVINMLSEQPTDECNGLKVTVPVKESDIQQFKYEASFILSFFDPLPIVIRDGFKFVATEVAEKLKNNDVVRCAPIVSYSSLYNSNVNIIMGGVVYGISLAEILIDLSDYSQKENLYSSRTKIITKYLERIAKNTCLFFKFPIGDVEVAASRETLSLTDETKMSIGRRIYNILNVKIEEDIERINQEPTMFDALKYIVKNITDVQMFILDYTWRGQKFEDICTKILMKNHNFTQFKYKLGRYDRVSYIGNLSLLRMHDQPITFVFSDDNKTTGYIRYCKDLSQQRGGYVFFIENVTKKALEKYVSQFDLEKVQYVSYTEYRTELLKTRKKNKTPRVTTSGPRVKQDESVVIVKRFELFTNFLTSSYSVKTDLVENEGRVYYLEDKEFWTLGTRDIMYFENHRLTSSQILNLYSKICDGTDDKDKVYIIKKNLRSFKKIEKFKVPHFREFFKKNVKDIFDAYMKLKDSYQFRDMNFSNNMKLDYYFDKFQNKFVAFAQKEIENKFGVGFFDQSKVSRDSFCCYYDNKREFLDQQSVAFLKTAINDDLYFAKLEAIENQSMIVKFEEIIENDIEKEFPLLKHINDYSFQKEKDNIDQYINAIEMLKSQQNVV